MKTTVWPKTFEKLSEYIVDGQIVVIDGSVDSRGGSENCLMADSITLIENVDDHYSSGIELTLKSSKLSVTILDELREVLAFYPGGCPVDVLVDLQGVCRSRLLTGIKVDVNDDLLGALDGLLSPGSIKLTGGA